MSVDGETSRPTDPTPPLSGDWPAQAADAVVNVVATVRDRTVGPLQFIARAIVYGLVIIPVAIMATTLVIIAAIRGLTAAVGEVWISYLILGLVFTLLGLVSWSKRRPATA